MEDGEKGGTKYTVNDSKEGILHEEQNVAQYWCQGHNGTPACESGDMYNGSNIKGYTDAANTSISKGIASSSESNTSQQRHVPDKPDTARRAQLEKLNIYDVTIDNTTPFSDWSTSLSLTAHVSSPSIYATPPPAYEWLEQLSLTRSFFDRENEGRRQSLPLICSPTTGTSGREPGEWIRDLSSTNI